MPPAGCQRMRRARPTPRHRDRARQQRHRSRMPRYPPPRRVSPAHRRGARQPAGGVDHPDRQATTKLASERRPRPSVGAANTSALWRAARSHMSTETSACPCAHRSVDENPSNAVAAAVSASRTRSHRRPTDATRDSNASAASPAHPSGTPTAFNDAAACSALPARRRHRAAVWSMPAAFPGTSTRGSAVSPNSVTRARPLTPSGRRPLRRHRRPCRSSPCGAGPMRRRPSMRDAPPTPV